jgi:hypothetical protein
MYNTDSPPPSELPSSRTLLRSTLFALAVAMLLLVAVVMPAEYGVDPTGVGRLTGLKRMGEIKQQLAREAAAAEGADVVRAAGDSSRPTIAAAPVASTTPAADSARNRATGRADTVRVTLSPGQGAEYKLEMRKAARATYSWSVDGGVVNYDLHADAPGIRYHGYAKGQALPAEQGTLVAAFDGMHGWFWRNRGTSPVTVTLRTSGEYQAIKRIE